MTRNTAAAKQLANSDITAKPSPKIERPWLAPAWQPGQSGNPAGRPRGARSKLAELTLQKLLADFEEHGTAAIEEVRKKSPANYLAAVVSLLPKQQEKIESPFSDLTDDELELLEQFLKSTRAKQITTIDARAEVITHDLSDIDRGHHARAAAEKVSPQSLSDAEIEQRLDAALNSPKRDTE